LTPHTERDTLRSWTTIFWNDLLAVVADATASFLALSV